MHNRRILDTVVPPCFTGLVATLTMRTCLKFQLLTRGDAPARITGMVSLPRHRQPAQSFKRDECGVLCRHMPQRLHKVRTEFNSCCP